MRSLWGKALLLIAAIWVVAGSAIFWARHVKATPETVSKYLEQHSLEGRSAADRNKVIEKVAEQMNSLSYEERRQVRVAKKLDGFFKTLAPEEQATFLDRTLPTGFKQMMDSLNKMEPAKRKQFVERALKDMKEHEGDTPPDQSTDQNARKIIDQGFKTFYNEANADVKMDVAPLIEQLQKNLQGFR